MAKVYVSSIINAPAARVWAVIRDFNAVPNWAPAIASSSIEGGVRSAEVGCIRNMKLGDGGVIRERLLVLSDRDMSFTYSILESPMGVENYEATLTLTRITDGDVTAAVWTAEFDAAEDREAELVTFIGTQVFQSAFDSLKGRFGS